MAHKPKRLTKIYEVIYIIEMANFLTASQRSLNWQQQYQSWKQEQAVQSFERTIGANIHSLSLRQIQKIRRQQQRLQAKAKRLRRRDNAKS